MSVYKENKENNKSVDKILLIIKWFFGITAVAIFVFIAGMLVAWSIGV